MAQRPRNPGPEEALRDTFFQLRDMIGAGASGAESALMDFIQKNTEGLLALGDPQINQIVGNYIKREIGGPELYQAPPDLPPQQQQQQQMPSQRDLRNELEKAARYGEESLFLEQDPAYAMAEEERMAGMGPEAIQEERRLIDQSDRINRQFLDRLEKLKDLKDLKDLEEYTPYINTIPGIDAADGGYITRKMNRGGIMSLRGY